jgi:cobalt-zinc-cadmium efflux system outer membrane protein
MSERVGLLVAITMTICGSAAGAQTNEVQVDRRPSIYVDVVDGFGVDDAVAQAIDREPALQASRTALGVAQGARVQASLRPNPTLNVFHQGEPSGTDTQTRAEVLWPLDLFRKGGRVAVADRQIEVADHEVADRIRLAAADVRTKYGEVAGAVRELAVLDELAGAASRQLELTSARVTEGAIPPLERDMLRVELIRIESDRLLQRGIVERALIALKRAMGMAPEMPLKIKNTLEDLVHRDASVPVVEGALTTARPDVAAAQSRVLMAEAEVGRVRQDARPSADLFGMYMRTDAAFPQRAFGSGGAIVPIRGQFDYVGAGIEVSLPFRDRRQGDLAAAQAQRAGVAAQLDATRLAAQAEIADARVRDTQARQAVDLFTAEGTRLARQNLSVVNQTYELGRATVFDVLAEQRRYLDFERAFTQALHDAYAARQALKRAVGEIQ